MSRRLLPLFLVLSLTLAPPAMAAAPSRPKPVQQDAGLMDITFRSWELKYKPLKEAADALGGSRPIRKIRKELRKELKRTHKFMKQVKKIQDTASPEAEEIKSLHSEGSLLINRLQALHRSLSQASLPADASDERKTRYATSRTDMLKQLVGLIDFLKDIRTTLNSAPEARS